MDTKIHRVTQTVGCFWKPWTFKKTEKSLNLCSKTRHISNIGHFSNCIEPLCIGALAQPLPFLSASPQLQGCRSLSYLQTLSSIHQRPSHAEPDGRPPGMWWTPSRPRGLVTAADWRDASQSPRALVGYLLQSERFTWTTFISPRVTVTHLSYIS